MLLLSRSRRDAFKSFFNILPLMLVQMPAIEKIATTLLAAIGMFSWFCLMRRTDVINRRLEALEVRLDAPVTDEEVARIMAQVASCDQTKYEVPPESDKDEVPHENDKDEVPHENDKDEVPTLTHKLNHEWASCSSEAYGPFPEVFIKEFNEQYEFTPTRGEIIPANSYTHCVATLDYSNVWNVSNDRLQIRANARELKKGCVGLEVPVYSYGSIYDFKLNQTDQFDRPTLTSLDVE